MAKENCARGRSSLKFGMEVRLGEKLFLDPTDAEALKLLVLQANNENCVSDFREEVIIRRND